MTQRARWALIGSGVLLIYGSAVLVFRIPMLGSVEDGLSSGVLDPAATIFQLVIFPLAFSVLVIRFPSELVDAARGDRVMAAVAILLVVIIEIAAIAYAIYDARRAVCSRLSTPEVYAGGDIRSELQGLRRQQIELAAKNHAAKGETPPADALSANECKILFKRDSPEPRNSDWARLRNDYCKALQPHVAPSNCRYFKSASNWAVVTAVGSTLAGMLGAAILVILALHIAVGVTLSSRSAAGLLTALALISPWLPLAAISQYYASFGVMDPRDYAAGIVVAIAIAITLIIWLLVKADKTLRSIISAILAGGFVTIGALAGMKMQVVNDVFSTMLALDGGSQLIIYFMIALVILGVAFAELRISYPRNDPPGAGD